MYRFVTSCSPCWLSFLSSLVLLGTQSLITLSLFTLHAVIMQLHYLLVEAYDILAWTRNALVNWMLYLYGCWVCHKSFLIHLGESLVFFKTVGTAWATSLLQEPWSQRSSWLVSTPSFKQPYTRRLRRFSSQNHCALMNDWFMFKAEPVWRKLKALIVHARRLIFGARFGLCLLLNMKFLSSQILAQIFWFLIAGTFWNFSYTTI